MNSNVNVINLSIYLLVDFFFIFVSKEVVLFVLELKSRCQIRHENKVTHMSKPCKLKLRFHVSIGIMGKTP